MQKSSLVVEKREMGSPETLNWSSRNVKLAVQKGGIGGTEKKSETAVQQRKIGGAET